MKKKVVSLIAVIVTIIFLVACGNAEEANNQTDETKDETGNDTAKQVAPLEEWPTETITFVVPYSPGGSADRQARALAPLLEEELGVSVLVENREGGGGAVGTTAHLKNDPNDGSYIIYQSHPHFDSGIMRGADYEFDDFDFLARTHGSPIAVYVKSDSEYNSLKDLIDKIKNNPGDLNYAMMNGSWSNISGEMMLDELGLEARGVPYDGGAPLRTALLAGEADFTFSDIEGMTAGVGDEARALGVFSSEPYEPDSDIPLVNDIMEDMGLDVEFPNMSNMRSIQVKKEFKEEYPERWELLVNALEKAITNEAFTEWGKTQGMNMSYNDPDEATQILKDAHETILQYKHVFE